MKGMLRNDECNEDVFADFDCLRFRVDFAYSNGGVHVCIVL